MPSIPNIGIPSIELDHLTVNLGGRTILNDLDGPLSGRVIGLLGPNGAGKSTLMQTLLGFYKPHSGTARVLGMDIRSDIKDIRHRIGYMPENDAFVSGMSAIRLVRMMGELSGLPRHVALERAHEILFFLGLGEARYRNVETYSLGMKQLAKLAVATVHGPQMLILDEPTNGLDAVARGRMIEIILKIRDSGHTQVLLSSHLLRDVEECCDEVLILKDGRVVVSTNLEVSESGSPRQPRSLCPGGGRTRLRIGGQRKPETQDDPSRRGRSSGPLPNGGWMRRGDSTTERETGFARRDLHESNGDPRWPFTDKAIKRTRAG